MTPQFLEKIYFEHPVWIETFYFPENNFQQPELQGKLLTQKGNVLTCASGGYRSCEDIFILLSSNTKRWDFRFFKTHSNIEFLEIKNLWPYSGTEKIFSGEGRRRRRRRKLNFAHRKLKFFQLTNIFLNWQTKKKKLFETETLDFLKTHSNIEFLDIKNLWPYQGTKKIFSEEGKNSILPTEN